MVISDVYVLARDLEEAKCKKERFFTNIEDASEVLNNAISNYPKAFGEYKIFHIQTIINEVALEN